MRWTTNSRIPATETGLPPATPHVRLHAPYLSLQNQPIRLNLICIQFPSCRDFTGSILSMITCPIVDGRISDLISERKNHSSFFMILQQISWNRYNISMWVCSIIYRLSHFVACNGENSLSKNLRGVYERQGSNIQRTRRREISIDSSPFLQRHPESVSPESISLSIQLPRDSLKFASLEISSESFEINSLDSLKIVRLLFRQISLSLSLSSKTLKHSIQIPYGVLAHPNESFVYWFFLSMLLFRMKDYKLEFKHEIF